MKLIEMTGRKFGRLTAIEEAGRTRAGLAKWKCVCDCGQTVNAIGCNLRNGHTRSCGCLSKELVGNQFRTHGMVGHKLYRVWGGMKARCGNPNNPAYQNYGGRGIIVCEDWKEPKTFFNWALSNGYKQGLEIDRIDNNGNYEPGNCRFVTPAKNARNRRTSKLTPVLVLQIRNACKKSNLTQQQIADKCGVSRSLISNVMARRVWKSV